MISKATVIRKKTSHHQTDHILSFFYKEKNIIEGNYSFFDLKIEFSMIKYLFYFRRKTYSAVENQDKYDKIHQYLFNRKSKPNEVNESPPDVKKKEETRPTNLKITEEKTTSNYDKDSSPKNNNVAKAIKPGAPLPFLAELQARKRSFSKPQESSPITKVNEPAQNPANQQPEKYVEKSVSQNKKSVNVREKSASELTTNANTSDIIFTNDLEEKQWQDSAQNVNSLKIEDTEKDRNVNEHNSICVVNDVMQRKLSGSEKVHFEQNVQKTTVQSIQTINDESLCSVLTLPTSHNVHTSNIQPVRNVLAIPSSQNVHQSVNTSTTTNTRPIQSVQPINVKNVQTAIVQPVQSTSQPPKRNSVVQIVPPQINTQTAASTFVESENLSR